MARQKKTKKKETLSDAAELLDRAIDIIKITRGQIGRGPNEITPADLAELQYFVRNNLLPALRKEDATELLKANDITLYEIQ